MSARVAALLATAGIVVLVAAQLIVPGWPGYHAWQYFAAIVICSTVVLAYIREARRGTDGDTGRRLVVSMLGGLVLAVAGLASGLLGPDTETVQRAPGSVAPLPAAGAAAFFPVADAATVAARSATIDVRRRNGASFALPPGSRRVVGALNLRPVERTAAYVDVRDSAGNHLTITQPTNPAFLSPVLFFPQSLVVAGKRLPADGFAVPAMHRRIKALYIASGTEGLSQAHALGGGSGVLVVVDDDDGRLVPGGIAIVPEGREIRIGGLRVRVAVGTYPSLELAAVPLPAALWLGGAMLAAGLVYALPRPARVVSSMKNV